LHLRPGYSEGVARFHGHGVFCHPLLNQQPSVTPIEIS
jgi:hypothetical protein